MEINHGKIQPVRIEDEMQKSYIDYAMSVIVSRALPDVRDGLKPVHRRILYAMHEAGMASNKPHKKSARIVGEVLGKYHPHGDSSVYDATVRLAQNFSTRYMMVDGHGNFGSVDGDSAAAMRYTEVRMSKIAEEMLDDIEKETVDFVPNYDESLQEPSVLPAKVPNLLINGATGIAVGMATNIPPHNLGEVVDGLVKMIDNPELSLEELIESIPGPDFPTGALIMGSDGIRSAYATGRGSVRMRACARIERMSNGKQRILVSELPYQVNKARLIETIADLVRNKVIEGLTDLRDESDRTGMRIVMEVRRDTNPDVLLNQLYKHTQLQDTFGVNMLALVDGRPRTLGLKEILHHYLEHQKIIIVRRTQFDLKKARDRAHILEGLRIALDHIDSIINTIREAQTVDIARIALMETFSLSERQAQAILDLRLQRLTGLEREKIDREYFDTLETIRYLESVLADEHMVFGIIRENLLEMKRKFNDKRRTQIIAQAQDFSREDLIAEEDIVISVTHSGYVKRQPIDTYRSQKRGGRGIQGAGTKEEDFVEHLFAATTHHHVFFFTTRGRVFVIKGYELPEASRTARGTAIINLLSLQPDEKISAVIPIKEFVEGEFLFMGTRNGIIKKTNLMDFNSVRKNGIIAIVLDDDDELIGVKRTDGKQQMILGTRDGMAINFHEQDVRPIGRSARGVKGINLQEMDQIVGMDIMRPDGQVLVVSELGFGKRTAVDQYRTQTRGGKGLINLKVTEKTGAVVGLRVVQPEQDLLLINNDGIIIRMDVGQIRVIGRNTQGVALMRMVDNQRIVALAMVDKTSEDADKPAVVVEPLNSIE
ncbi:MAG: DNA gyrase subunit A [Negativicutes bacterium]